MEILKVSSKSNPSRVAGAIANIFREDKCLEIQTIGAGSLNQAIKAIIIARSSSISNGFDIASYPHFSEVVISGEEKTSIDIVLKKDLV